MIPFEYIIWTADECADYFKESKEHFLRDTRHRSGFPKPIEAGNKRPRWRAKDVAEWFLSMERVSG